MSYKEIVNLIGQVKAEQLISRLGGVTLSLPRYKKSKYLSILTDIVGADAARKLCRTYAGDVLYIPKNIQATYLQRNRLLMKAFLRYRSLGYSKREALIKLCPKFGLSERQVRRIINTYEH